MITIIAFIVVILGVFTCKVIDEGRKELKKLTIIDQLELKRLIIDKIKEKQ